LGKSSLERTVRRLQHAGLHSISIVGPGDLAEFVGQLSRKYRGITFVRQTSALNIDGLPQVEKRAEKVLVMQLGAYVEFNVVDVLQFHEATQESVIRLYDREGPLDVWVIDVQSGQFDGDVSWLCGVKTSASSSYLVDGYVNRLRNWQDLRTLTTDIFLGRCEGKPSGREKTPGIWVADGARVHRSASIVAPAYIGQRARVGAGAVITRLSSVERCCDVGAGTLVENSTILPYTRVGNELRVSHALADGARLISMGTNVTVTVSDERLLSSTAPASRGRFVSAEVPIEKPAPQVPGLKHAPYRGAILPRVLGFQEDEL
jgi:NDP-sugar pyrophosphorylase family protein